VTTTEKHIAAAQSTEECSFNRTRCWKLQWKLQLKKLQ